MRHPRSVKPERIADMQFQIQIVDTHKTVKAFIPIGFLAD
jgi:hypothetical protein